MFNKTLDRVYYIFLALIIFIGVIIRLKFFFMNPSLWNDESAVAWNILNKNYIELFQPLRFVQVAPPAFLILIKFIVNLLHAQNNIWFCDLVMRTIPLIIGLTIPIIFYFLSTKLLNSKLAIIIGLLFFTLNPILINYSYELKPYIIDVLCTICILIVFLNIDLNNKKPSKLFYIGILLSIMPWFSFTSAIVLFAGFTIMSFYRENPKNYLILSFPVLISVFLYLRIFIMNNYLANKDGMFAYWSGNFIEKNLSNLTSLNIHNMQYFFEDIPHLSYSIVTLLAIIGFILFIKDKKYRFLSIFIITLATVVILSVLKIYPYYERLVSFIIPFIILFTAKAFDIKNRILSSIVFVLLTIPFFILSINLLKMKEISKQDYARQMMIIMSNKIEPEDTIVIGSESNIDFVYYNMFFKFKHNKIFMLKNREGKNLNFTLNNFSKGVYWLFISYGKNADEYLKWAESNSKILFNMNTKKCILTKILID